MENQQGESVVVSLPSSLGCCSERSAATASIRKLWSTVTYLIRQLWSTVIYPIGQCCWALIFTPSRDICGDVFDEVSSPTSPIEYIVFGIIFGPLWLAHIILPPIKYTWKLLRRKAILTCIAVSLDPFFFYIPIINQENKCLGVDKKLRNTLLVLRSVTDFASVLHIVSQVRDWTIDPNPDSHTDTESYFDSELRPTTSLLQKLMKSIVDAINGTMPWLSLSLVIDFLALLPVPQVAIVVIFFKMGGSKFFLQRTILNVLLIFQYIPRICQIYLSSKKLERVGIWVKGAFNFFLYILAGHVLASFWYFFSIQRETSCWHQTCRNVIGCTSTYECGDSTLKNISLLNELCPISSPNDAVFDFGIYLDILQSGNTGSIDFSRKFFYSLWWGIRNLSNFGTNLETSSYVWENCFAILIGLIGLLLFLYLIGNVQTYIQLATTKSVKIEEKAVELRRSRINKKYREMKMWMSSNGLPEDLKTTIREYIKKSNVAEKYIDAPVSLKILYGCAEEDGREDITNPMVQYVTAKALQKVPMFESVDEEDLKYACEFSRLDPSIYPENSYIVRAGKRCDRVIFIIEGVIELTDTTSNGAETTGSSSTIKTERLEKGQYYGQELLNWAVLNYERGYDDCKHTRPIWTRDVKCRTEVEALCIEDKDLLDLLRRVRRYYNWRQNKWVKRTLPHDNTDETLNKTNLQPATTELEEIEETKKMKMKNVELDKGGGEPREDIADTGASASTTVEQIIHLQGEMLREQLVLARQNRDDIARLGRKLDDMAVILATL